jgi:hypothetical protein
MTTKTPKATAIPTNIKRDKYSINMGIPIGRGRENFVKSFFFPAQTYKVDPRLSRKK